MKTVRIALAIFALLAATIVAPFAVSAFGDAPTAAPCTMDVDC